MKQHLAQLNIARAKYDNDDPRFAGFIDNLDRVNTVADRSKGFIWRLQEEDGEKTIAPTDDPQLIVNLSVWETAEDLEHFVFNTIHKRIYDGRAAWFPKMEKAHFVMWWIPAGHIPTVDEAFERLEKLRADGPTDEAFGWERLEKLKLWMTKQCA